MEDFKSALDSFKSALELEIKLGHKEREIVVLGNIADSHRRSNELNIAIEYYEKILKLAQDLGDKEESAAILLEISLILINQSKFSEAINIFGDVMNIYREIKDPYALQKTLGSLGYCSVALGDYSNAKIFCEKALALAKN